MKERDPTRVIQTLKSNNQVPLSGEDLSLPPPQPDILVQDEPFIATPVPNCTNQNKDIAAKNTTIPIPNSGTELVCQSSETKDAIIIIGVPLLVLLTIIMLVMVVLS